jgi:excisionase family DNA binding protein
MKNLDRAVMNTKQVAKRLGICERVAREIMKNELPHFRIGKNLRVDSVDLERWIKTNSALQMRANFGGSSNGND